MRVVKPVRFVYKPTDLVGVRPEHNEEAVVESSQRQTYVDTPGLLFHGVIQTDDKALNQRRLAYILTKGLLPRKKVPLEFLEPHAGYQGLYPDWVSMRMLPKYTTYKFFASWPYGPEGGGEYNIAFVLDQNYVKANAQRFYAVGNDFMDRLADYQDDLGNIFGGIRYFPKLDKRRSAYRSEVWAKHIPPNALSAIIVANEYAPEIRAIIVNNFPEKPIRIFNPNGALLFGTMN